MEERSGESNMNWWPFITKKHYLKVVRSYQFIIKYEQEQFQEAIFKQQELLETARKCYNEELENTSQLVDETIKQLSTLIIKKDGPPFEWSLTIYIDSDLVAKLRDPSVWGGKNIDIGKKANRLISHRFSRMLEKQLKTKGLKETEDWK